MLYHNHSFFDGLLFYLSLQNNNNLNKFLFLQGINMDILLIIIGLGFCIIGIVVSILPILSGPPFGWLGLLLLELTTAIPNNYWFLGVTFIIAIGVFLLDYMMPSISIKKFGGLGEIDNFVRCHGFKKDGYRCSYRSKKITSRQTLYCQHHTS